MDKSLNETRTESMDGGKVTHFFRKEVRDKIEKHPCYSKDASKYARMHLPVAPACNIQCNYCNRKYDCSNESRPGVVSKLSDPHGALRQFQAVTKRTDALSVVGIAGPGDALANPQSTFATLKLIREENPDVQLCISTNGLALAEHIDNLIEVGVNHLTITINCIDPEVGKNIYPWIFFNHQRYRGVEAAKILIKRQLEGLKLASEAGMLVKVNTVLIPGVNDFHISAVSEKVRSLGAMLHNVMPLISEPEHGTFYGLTGQRGPTDDEIELARKDSGSFMPQMTHCQQCRADAVGTLGGGCSSGAETESNDQAAIYRVAVAATSDSHGDIINTHFGYAEQFEIYEFVHSTQSFKHVESRIASRYCSGASECGDDESYKQTLIDAISDVDELLCSRIGITPWRELEKQGVTPNIDFAYASVNQALETIAMGLDTSIAEAENDVFNY
ncbi:nitrogenase cofactor biosynthesis protein NifB [Vibrio hannami]|uniref:nitrogenase cofactor biosynthesis protein NifB n=1 Tax=Vibrio hannami TaxID=2717094 RepID=UPI00240EF61E|nr:nitrogenase cofactor biosynthesis protein NifB [Vibrio hannami]MDG3085035.1 nitrogenase cofactor biosynthesis protein NifB [Vibrio hannami]